MQISNTEGDDKENDGAGQNPENGSYNLNTIKTKSITICTMSINTLAELTFSVLENLELFINLHVLNTEKRSNTEGMQAKELQNKKKFYKQ